MRFPLQPFLAAALAVLSFAAAPLAAQGCLTARLEPGYLLYEVLVLKDDWLFVGSKNGTRSVDAYRRSGQNWFLHQTLEHPETPGQRGFGRAIAVDGETLVVSDPHTDSAWVYGLDGGRWNLRQRLESEVEGNEPAFGNALALRGDLLILGDSFSSEAVWRGGGVHVYRRREGLWERTQTLIPEDVIENQRTGNALALAGNQLLVGASQRSMRYGNREGVVYVYEEEAGTWVHVQTLVAPERIWFSQFGGKIEVRGDAALISAAGVFTDGRVHAFERRGGLWEHVQEFGAGLEEASGFGREIHWSGDLAYFSCSDTYEGRRDWAYPVFERVLGEWRRTRVQRPEAPLRGEDHTGKMAVDGDQLVVSSRRRFPFWYLRSIETFLEIRSTDPAACPTLRVTPTSLSLSRGGTQRMRLLAGEAYAGLPYVLLGSMATSPRGLPTGGPRLPLAWDGYLKGTLTGTGTAHLDGHFGHLDAKGRSDAAFTLPPGTESSLVGTAVYHAFVVFDGAEPVHVSNPRPLFLTR